MRVVCQVPTAWDGYCPSCRRGADGFLNGVWCDCVAKPKLTKDQIRAVLAEHEVRHTTECRTKPGNVKGDGGHPPSFRTRSLGGYRCICDWYDRVLALHESALLREAMAAIDACVKPFGVPRVEALPPEPGDDPTVFRGRITGIPSAWFLDKSAAEMRALGMTVAPSVPDCATLKLQENGLIAFDWIEVGFTLTPIDGAS